jgi:hypothetical protein
MVTISRLQASSYLGSTVKLGYNIMKGTEYFVSLEMSVVITTEHNVMVNGEKLICTTEYLTL